MEKTKQNDCRKEMLKAKLLGSASGLNEKSFLFQDRRVTVHEVGQGTEVILIQKSDRELRLSEARISIVLQNCIYVTHSSFDSKSLNNTPSIEDAQRKVH